MIGQRQAHPEERSRTNRKRVGGSRGTGYSGDASGKLLYVHTN